MRLTLALFALLFPLSHAHADDVEWTCEGDYNKGAKYDETDNASVAIHAKLHVLMLGDSQGDNDDEYPVERAELTMTATNNKNLDAGSFKIRNKKAKKYSGSVDRYKGHVRILMGKGSPAAYKNLETDPSFFVFMPWNDETGSDGDVWVQRSNTGQEALPAFKLKCDD